MYRLLLLIDIDGVISLSGFDAGGPPPGRFALVDGIPHFLSATAGELLGGLERRFELVWCSGWEERADEYLPRALGLPAGLGHLTFARPDLGASIGADRGASIEPGRGASSARHWKLDAIDAYAGPSRPLAWIDDAFDDSCHAWAHARPGPTKLVLTEPAIGLTAEQTRGLEAWADSLRAG